jgi:hypothetical protein
VYIIDKKSKNILRRMYFPNNIVIATIDDSVVYLYNDKLGYFIDASTGAFSENILLIDNYGGLSESDRPFISRPSDGHWYLETTAVISSWSLDGTVRSRPHLTMNGIAFNCFVNGETGEILEI